RPQQRLSLCEGGLRASFIVLSVSETPGWSELSACEQYFHPCFRRCSPRPGGWPAAMPAIVPLVEFCAFQPVSGKAGGASVCVAVPSPRHRFAVAGGHAVAGRCADPPGWPGRSGFVLRGATAPAFWSD